MPQEPTTTPFMWTVVVNPNNSYQLVSLIARMILGPVLVKRWQLRRRLLIARDLVSYNPYTPSDTDNPNNL